MMAIKRRLCSAPGLLLAVVLVFGWKVPAPAAERPELEFHNRRREVVEVFWLPEGDAENAAAGRKLVATVAAGSKSTVTTTLGHRFVAEAEGYSQEITALRDRQVVTFASVETEALRAKLAKVAGYTSQDVEGWTLLVSDQLRGDEPEATGRAIELLAGQCRRVIDALVAAPEALEKVRRVPLWFSSVYEGGGMTAEYHPGAKWLADNGRNPLLVESVEFTNIPIFDKEVVRMPMLLLHELAHAYHHQFVGHDHAGLRAAFRNAVLTKSYENVARHNGKPQKAYAMTNVQEYFAETSEAYFGQNDFYPFDREDLLKHDPEVFRQLAELWEGRRAETEKTRLRSQAAEQTMPKPAK